MIPNPFSVAYSCCNFIHILLFLYAVFDKLSLFALAISECQGGLLQFFLYRNRYGLTGSHEKLLINYGPHLRL